MNRKQKSIIINFIGVICCTAVFMIVMVNVRGVLNKSEAMRTMELLGQQVHEYREKHRSSPPESFIITQRQNMKDARLGEMIYRAQWIGYNPKPDDILAYSKKTYGFIAGNGYVVMFLDGSVKWMERTEFEELLGQHQSEAERELLRENPIMR